MVGIVNVILGIGVLMRYRLAVFGMVAGSFVGFAFDFINFQAHNPAGALLGFAINLFIVLCLPTARAWFWPPGE
jgi:hypothetical protein